MTPQHSLFTWSVFTSGISDGLKSVLSTIWLFTMFTFLRRDLQSLVKWALYLQEVQVVSFAGQTARCPFEKVPPHFIQVLLLSILRVGSLFTVKRLCGLCTDDPLDLKLFVSFQWFKISFSSMSACLVLLVVEEFLSKVYLGCRSFSCCLW